MSVPSSLGREVIGIELWTGLHGQLLPNGDHEFPTEYFSRTMKGVVDMGSDWIKYDNGELHVYPEASIRRVVFKDTRNE